MNPSPPPLAQAKSREGFVKDTLFTDTKSGREALKCALPPKPLQRDRILLRISCFMVASSSLHPFTRSTSSQMGGRSASPATPHVKRGCSRNRSATFPAGAAYDGEGRDSPTPSTTTPCRAAAKAWTETMENLKAVSPSAGGGPMGYPLPPYVPQPPCPMPCGGG